MIKEFDKNNEKYKVFSATDTIVEEIKNIDKKIKEYTKLMKDAASNLEFETAVIYRDKIKELEFLAMKNL